MLCDTCRDYPRHMEEFEGVREGSLSLSCIEAAKLILGGMEPVRFFSFSDKVEDEEYEDFDYLLFTKLMDARERIIAVLQNRDIDIMMRMAMVLDFAQDIQDAVDGQKLYEIDERIQAFGELDTILSFQQDIDAYQIGENEYCAAVRKMFRIFYKLEVLKADWPEYVKKAEFSLFSEGQKNYESNRNAFHQTVGLKSPNGEVWSIWLEHLMVYFVFTYFCGAVYDENVIGKMKTAVVATLLIRELAIAKWQEQGNVFDFAEFVDIAHRVSREVEHSDTNLLRFEKLCEKMPVFHTKELLRLILY